MPPKVTAVAPVKFVPVITTEVPPPVEPVVGLSEVIAGGVAPADALSTTPAITWRFMLPLLCSMLGVSVPPVLAR